MNQMKIAIAVFAIVLVIVIINHLIKFLARNNNEADEQAVNPQPEQVIEIKKSSRKIWNWIVLIAIISAIIGAIFIVPKYFKGDWNLSIPASVIWKKKPHQYGRVPEDRTSGYLNATITEDSETKFCFTVDTTNGKSYYTGRRSDKESKIEGSWINSPDGGKW